MKQDMRISAMTYLIIVTILLLYMILALDYKYDKQFSMSNFPDKIF